VRRLLLRRPRLGRDEKGATLVEFAFVAPVLVLTLFGIFDLGYKSYVASVLQGALHEAARLGTVGHKTTAQLDAHIQNRLVKFSRNATITITHNSYLDFSGVKVPETITSDTAPTGQYNVGDCYQDANANNQYDTDRGKAGMGNSEDVLHYSITINYPRLFPLARIVGWSATDTVTSSTVFRNQPYGSRVTAVTVKCT
jgi:Flp pilus assembly protein TadG